MIRLNPHSYTAVDCREKALEEWVGDIDLEDDGDFDALVKNGVVLLPF